MNPHAMILRFFEYAHLPEHLQVISEPFCELAHKMAVGSIGSATTEETAAGLRKLLEAKDCFVRAQLDKKAKTK